MCALCCSVCVCVSCTCVSVRCLCVCLMCLYVCLCVFVCVFVSPLTRSTSNLPSPPILSHASRVPLSMFISLLPSHSFHLTPSLPSHQGSKTPPKAGAFVSRSSAPTQFRKFYERGDFPVSIDHDAKGMKICWKVCICLCVSGCVYVCGVIFVVVLELVCVCLLCV